VSSPTAARALRDKVKQLSLFQKARDVLEAEIVNVEPDFGDVRSPGASEDGGGGD